MRKEGVTGEMSKEQERAAFVKTGLEITGGTQLTSAQLDSCMELWHTKQSEWSDEFKSFYREYVRNEISLDLSVSAVTKFVLQSSQE